MWILSLSGEEKVRVRTPGGRPCRPYVNLDVATQAFINFFFEGNVGGEQLAGCWYGFSVGTQQLNQLPRLVFSATPPATIAQVP
jgi:hypothetical protein